MQSRAGTIAAVLFTALLTVSCSEGRSSHATVLPNDSGTSDLGIGVPHILQHSRRVNLNQLTVEVTIGGGPVTMARVDDQWSGRFSLPEGAGSYTLQITWFQSVNGSPLPLAAAQPVELSAQSDRNIHISEYSWQQFDEDGDRTSNLDELNAGTDPLVAGTGDSAPAGQPAPGVDQTDCRDARDRLPTAQFHAGGIKLFGRTFIFNVTPPTSSPDIFIYFYGDKSGQLMIEHLTGDPTPSTATLYDSDLTGKTRFLVIEQSPTTESRATVSMQVRPGIYCYALGPSSDPSLAEEFSDDVTMRVTFREL
ncbi:MAG: hypothetical protein V3U76_05315 [Granulosicoccus sp.]